MTELEHTEFLRVADRYLDAANAYMISGHSPTKIDNAATRTAAEFRTATKAFGEKIKAIRSNSREDKMARRYTESVGNYVFSRLNHAFNGAF